MNLVLVTPDEIDTLGRVTVQGARATHLTEVLRVSPGQPVRVGLVDGPMGTATVVEAGSAAVTLACVFEAQAPPRPRVDLLLAVPRPKVLRRLWAQLAALGVGRVILTNAERVERNYFDTHVLDPQVYRPLLVEGLQQARDTHVPLVTVHRRFRPLVEDELDTLSPSTLRIVAHPGAAVPVPELAASAAGRRVLLAVGPEGGWNAFELRLLESKGFQQAGMGARTLRTDTACIALLALVHDAIGRS